MNGQRTIRISGHVQGVYFRSAARNEARRLGLAGFARNESDGSVLIEAEGDETALAQFVAWCHDGPRQARVERVEVEQGDPRGFADFTVRR